MSKLFKYFVNNNPRKQKTADITSVLFGNVHAPVDVNKSKQL